jgi:hypothetical protein
MRQITLLSLILVVSMTAATGQTGLAETNHPSSQEAEILRLDLGILMARTRAAASPDKAPKIVLPEKVVVPDLSEALADDYTRIGSRGQVITRQEELEKSRGIVLTQPCTGRIQDIRVHLLDTAAVVTSLVRVESCDNKNFESAGRYRVTNVYAKRQGKWQLMSSQWTGASL